MVAFRNKWSWGPPWGLSIRMSQEMGSFPVVYGNNCQYQSVTPKTFGSYTYKNVSWYIRNRTIMVAFRNKLFRRHSRGPIVWIYQQMGRFLYGVRAQLPNSKCYTKNFYLEWVQESVKIHTEHNYYSGIP